MNTLQFEHTDLRSRAPRRRKAADFAASRQYAMARDDQRHRILGHGFADIASGFRSGAEFLGQRAVGRRVPPTDPPRRIIDLLKKRGLLTEVEPEAGKIRLLAIEITLRGGDRFNYLWRRPARFGVWQPAQQISFGRFGAARRQLEARDADVVPRDTTETGCSFEDKIMVHCMAH